MFQDILHKIAQHVDGVMGCVLLDADAVTLAELHLSGDPDAVNGMAVELSNLVASLARRGSLETTGPVSEFLLETERMTTVCHRVGADYLLVASFEPDADIARGQAMLRLVAPWIERAL